jgi:hypothetical protein
LRKGTEGPEPGSRPAGVAVAEISKTGSTGTQLANARWRVVPVERQRHKGYVHRLVPTVDRGKEGLRQVYFVLMSFAQTSLAVDGFDL